MLNKTEKILRFKSYFYIIPFHTKLLQGGVKHNSCKNLSWSFWSHVFYQTNLSNLFLLPTSSFYTTISFRLISTHHTALAASMCLPQKQLTNNITHHHCHHWPKPLLLQQPWSPSHLDNIVSSSYWLNTQAVLLVAQSTKLPYLFIDDAWVTGFLVDSFIPPTIAIEIINVAYSNCYHL